MSSAALRLAREALPSPVKRVIRRLLGREHYPEVGRVNFGDLRRLEPISRHFGLLRGSAIDRFYIEERFLREHASLVRGRVLEIGDATYTRQFGGDRVTQSDVLHAVAGNPNATVVGDLCSGAGLRSNAFDCIILTQTLLVIYDVQAAVRTLHRILSPGGVALVTVPGISQVSRFDMDAWGDYWRFTERSARRLFEEAFPATNLSVQQWGNVLAATCFLQGIAAEEVTIAELDFVDRDYPVTIGIVARRAT